MLILNHEISDSIIFVQVESKLPNFAQKEISWKITDYKDYKDA